jgi:hypothetical protein
VFADTPLVQPVHEGASLDQSLWGWSLIQAGGGGRC